MLELNKINLDERADFVFKLNSEPDFKKEVGENLLILIERLDYINKPNIIGKLFCFYISGKTYYSNSRRLSIIIDIIYLRDLNLLPLLSIYEKKQRDADELENISKDAQLSLVNAGLLYDTGEGIGPYYKVTEPGNLIISLLYS